MVADAGEDPASGTLAGAESVFVAGQLFEFPASYPTFARFTLDLGVHVDLARHVHSGRAAIQRLKEKNDLSINAVVNGNAIFRNPSFARVCRATEHQSR